MKEKRPQVVKELFEHIARGEEATEILFEIYCSGTSIYDLNLPPKVKERLLRFFSFDDSE